MDLPGPGVLLYDESLISLGHLSFFRSGFVCPFTGACHYCRAGRFVKAKKIAVIGFEIGFVFGLKMGVEWGKVY